MVTRFPWDVCIPGLFDLGDWLPWKGVAPSISKTCNCGDSRRKEQVKRLWFWYSDRIARMTTGERAILIVELLCLLSVWACFFLVITVLERILHL